MRRLAAALTLLSQLWLGWAAVGEGPRGSVTPPEARQQAGHLEARTPSVAIDGLTGTAVGSGSLLARLAFDTGRLAPRDSLAGGRSAARLAVAAHAHRVLVERSDPQRKPSPLLGYRSRGRGS